jgi:hypothetical protein
LVRVTTTVHTPVVPAAVVNVPVTRPIDIEVSDGQSVDLVVDLNAPAWLAALDPVTRTIDESVFAGLVNVVTR